MTTKHTPLRSNWIAQAFTKPKSRGVQVTKSSALRPKDGIVIRHGQPTSIIDAPTKCWY